MQQIAYKKIQLSRLKEQDEYWQQMENRKKLEVQVINDLLHEKNKNNADLVDQALKKAELLQ